MLHDLVKLHGSKLVSVLACVVAVTSGLLGTRGHAAQVVTFEDAILHLKGGDTREAIDELKGLAVRGDARAQYLLGLALIEGKLLSRDIPQGIAWLQVAANGYDGQFGRSAADDARRTLDEVLPQASGTDMIKADQISAAFTRSRAEEAAATVANGEKVLQDSLPATARITSSKVTAPGPVPGCALVPALASCYVAELPGTAAERCRGTFPKRDVDPTLSAPLAKRVAAIYTKGLRHQAWEGRVVLMMHVDRSGYVCQVLLAQGSGVGDLDDAILLAAQRARFTPATAQGEPVEALVPQPIEFRISDLVLR